MNLGLKIKKIFFAVFGMVLICGGVYAKNYSVCLGSFSVESNAREFCQKLKEKNIQCHVRDFKVDSGTLYRVVSLKEFSNPQDARNLKEKILRENSKNGNLLKNLWIVSTGSEEDVRGNGEPVITQMWPLDEVELEEGDAAVLEK